MRDWLPSGTCGTACVLKLTVPRQNGAACVTGFLAGHAGLSRGLHGLHATLSPRRDAGCPSGVPAPSWLHGLHARLSSLERDVPQEIPLVPP
eukprot:352576-Chlamydomonas_euryale.AAC.4